MSLASDSSLTHWQSKKLSSIFVLHAEAGDKYNKLVIIGTDGNSIFFRYEGQSEIFKWDADTKFDPSNFKVVHKSESCLLSTHIFPDYRNSKIKALESNFPDYIQGKAGCGALQQIKAIEGC